MKRTTWIVDRREELLAGAASGFALALSFPPFPTRFLAAFALAPILWYFAARLPALVEASTAARDGRRPRSPMRERLARGAFAGFALGVVFFTTLLFWILFLIPESGVVSRWILLPALALLVAYLACYTTLFGLALAWFTGRFPATGIWAAPALWTLAEYARAHGELGFSWGMIANALAVHPVAIQGLAFYGAFGLSLVLVFLNLLVVLAIRSRGARARCAAAAAFVVVAGGHLLWGRAEIARFDAVKQPIAGEGAIAVVQPNVDLGLKWEPAYRDSLFRQMEKYIGEAARAGARLVVFPETAAPVSFKASPEYLGRLEYDAASNGIDILTGYVDHSMRDGEWAAHNAAALISSSGALAGNYHKVNLLPFGEKMPWSQYIPALAKLEFGQANFIAGTKRTLFRSRAGSFGVLICFESTFAGYTRGYVRDGVDFLVNITNDGWFGNNQGPIQHEEMAILRAVENRTTLVRAAYTGVSTVVDPVGRSGARVGLFTEGMIFGTPERGNGRSFFSRHGDLPYFAGVVLSIAAACLVRRRGAAPAHRGGPAA